MTLFYKIFSFFLVLILLVSPTAAFAQYGGGTTVSVGNGNSGNNSPVFTASASGDTVTISIENAKKGSNLDIKIGSSTNGVFRLKFTLGADIVNAKIILNKIDNSQIFSDLPGTPVLAYSITLVNITYEQILNFNFSFKAKKSLVDGKKLTAYSSNSPWAIAGLSTESDSNVGNDENGYVGSTAIAFKQYALTASAINVEPVRGNSAEAPRGSVKGVDEVRTTLNSSDMDKSGGVNLIRTGGTENGKIITTVLALVALVGLSLGLVKSNQKQD